MYFTLSNMSFEGFGSISTKILLLIAIGLILFKFVNDRYRRNLPPGPIGLPFVGYLPFLGEKSYKTLASLKEKYGPIISVRLGSKLVVVLNEFNVLSETLIHPAALDRSPGIFDHVPRSGFITRNGEEWTEQRRFTLQSTRDLGLGRKGWELLVQEEVDEFVNSLKLLKGLSSDISHSLLTSLTNSILIILIGRKLNLHEEVEIRTMAQFADCTLTYTGPSYAVSLMPRFRKCLEYFGIAGYDEVAGVVSKFASFVREEINKHKMQDQYQGVVDFINLYLQKEKHLSSMNKKHHFSDDDLEGNVKIYFLGGTDTIFSSLGWLFRIMAKFPDIQKEVQEELDEQIGREGKITYETRYKLPYTMSVLMEAQRYSSIVPLNTTRRASYDFKIRGYTIPAGTDIIGNLWAIHNDSTYWDSPEKFLPGRFLSDDKKSIKKNHPSFLPFSIGRRNCPGETAAWMSILQYFTSVLQAFDIRTEDGVQPEFVVEEGLVSHLKPQPLRFIER